MNLFSRVAGIGLAGWLGAGCVVSIGGGDGGKSRSEVPKPLPPPVVVVSPNTEDAAVLAEIDAAGRLNFDAGKVTALKNVAARPDLSAAAQVHLVNTVLNRLSFDAGKVEVLRVLIESPAFAPAAKEAVFRQLERLSFDASRTAVMEAIQARAAGR